MTKKQTASIIFNSIIFVLTTFATVCMLAGIQLMDSSQEILAFTSSTLEAFKYFTVDSNVLAGLVALAYVILQILTAKGKTIKAPRFIYCLKLAATAGVTLTMTVTVCFLIPQFGEYWYILFENNNLFFHLIIPLLCLITFVFFEPFHDAAPVPFVFSLTGTIPMATYAVFYTTNIICHMNNGHPLKEYDWYNFLNGSLSNALIAVPAMILTTWGLSIALWFFNRLMSKKI